MAKPENQSFDIFYKNTAIPDARSVFTWRPKPLLEIKSDCLVAFDTNVLLVPYNVKGQSFEKIAAVYKELSRQDRLLVAGQVAREFALLRYQKLSEIIKTLSDQASRARGLSLSRYPLLESVEEFKELLKIEEQMRSITSSLQDATSKVVERVNDWTWNDPVSQLYSEVFPKAVHDLELSDDRKEEIAANLVYRTEHKIPPGYKDQSKADDGIGDLLIWMTLLEFTKGTGKDLIFVTGEEKPDWWHLANNKPLCPRVELVQEYLMNSGGSFHMMSLSGFLEYFDVAPEVVDEVRTREAVDAVMPSQKIPYAPSVLSERQVKHMALSRLFQCLENDRLLVEPEIAPSLYVDAIIKNLGDNALETIVDIQSASESLTTESVERLLVPTVKLADTYGAALGRSVCVILILVTERDYPWRISEQDVKRIENVFNHVASRRKVSIVTQGQLRYMQCSEIQKILHF